MGTTWRSVICAWLVATLAVGGCRAPVPPARLAPPGAATTGPAPLATPGTGRRQVALAPDAQLTAQLGAPRVAAAAITSTPLSPADTAALLARLEPLPAPPASAPPALLAPTPPPRRAGAVAPIAFLAPTGRAVPSAPISRERLLAAPEFSPTGEVAREREVRVRFGEPMVPIAALGAALGAAATPPATLTPAVPGTWRWLDTRVLAFTATAERLPQATAFRVQLPAGLRAINGARATHEVTAAFTTAPLQLAGAFPDTARRDAPIALHFDQAIDPARVLPFVRATDARGRQIAIRAITRAEAEPAWRRDPRFASPDQPLAALAGARPLILAPTAGAWPAGDLAITLRRGAPSAEGPLLATRDSRTRIEIAPAFTLRGVACDDERPRLAGAACPASSSVQLLLSNPIDDASYRTGSLGMAPGPAREVLAHHDRLVLLAPPGVGATHTIDLPAGLRDSYGQPLTGPRRTTLRTTALRHTAAVSADDGLLVLDPRFAIPQWVVTGEALDALHISLYRVQPSDYFAYLAWERGERATPPGARVTDVRHPIGVRHGAVVRVDLRPALAASGVGHVIAIASGAPTTGRRRDDERTRSAWIQVTRLGVAARFDRERAHAWVQDVGPTRLLAAVAGARTELLVEGQPAAPAAQTDAGGHTTLALPELAARDRERPSLLLASAGDDTAFAAIAGTQVESVARAIRSQQALWYVADDRFIYRPGEPVYVKGWLRWTHDGVAPELAKPAAGDSVSYVLRDGGGNDLSRGTTRLTDAGGFDLALTLPATARLGDARLALTSRGATHEHPLRIEEFRRPAFAVALDDDLELSGAQPVVVGEALDMRATASYYSGGGLPGAGIAWRARLSPTTYAPPGWDGYAFAAPVPRSQRSALRGRARPVVVDTPSGLTGASTSQISYAIPALPDAGPALLAVDATVTDVDRAAIRASSRQILVHPATIYVGLRLRAGDQIEAIATTIDGAPVPGVPIAITIEGVAGRDRFRDDATVIDRQACQLTSAASPVRCPIAQRNLSLAYDVIATVSDARGRQHAARLQLPWWARGRDTTPAIAATADRDSYRPGDVAKVELRSALYPATAVVTIARQGVISQRRLALTGPQTIDVPIAASMIENVHVVVDRVAAQPSGIAGHAPLPDEASTDLSLTVARDSERLQLRNRPLTAVVAPGAPATFEVEVRHADRPVAGAEVALIVVDEAVLALSGEHHADPLAPFYRELEHGTRPLSSIALIRDASGDLDGDPGVRRYRLDDELAGSLSGVGSGYGSMGGGAGGGSVGGTGAFVPSRKDFRATAAFSPRLRTDAHGRVRLTATMPDSLTRFRIVALASADVGRFGLGESTIATQRPLNARTVAPRFLTQGDAFSLPVVVQNLDPAPRTVDVAVRAANLDPRGPAGVRVTIPGGQRAEVRFALATRTRGPATIQTIARAGDAVDASTVTLPVYEPATTEAFATYGVVDDAPRFERLEVPADIHRDIGGVEVELAATQLQSLTDAYWYLYAYPYECAEQRSSRMLATTALADILEAFAAPGRPERAALDATRANDLRVLARDQRPDGGWGYFADLPSDSFVTMQVLAALGRPGPGAAGSEAVRQASRKAAALVSRRIDLLLRELEQPAHARDAAAAGSRAGLAAAGLAALAATGADVHARALRLHRLASASARYPIDARARVLAVLAGRADARVVRGELVRALVAATRETAAAATVDGAATASERELLGSSAKSGALVLDALIREVPDHPLIPKLARGVLDAQRGGRWATTQDNLVALSAMRRYFDAYEKAPPRFTGQVWLGSAGYTERAFAGRDGSRAHAQVGWDALAGGGHDVAIARTGSGRMYYRLGIRYAPQRTDLPALDAGFVVRRSYVALDDPGDVRREPDGSWRIALGARIEVVLEATITAPRHAVALVDPLPAGLEPVNERLATSERAAPTTGARWDHINLRDQRGEAFAMRLAPGSHRFTYTARATTPGQFLAAPAKAEEMYSPESFGRSTGERVLIE